MRVFGMCLDWRVLGGLASVAVIVAVTHPAWLGLALPYLLFLACPLSMLLMMRMMGDSSGARSGATAMPMAHPDVVREPTIAVPLSVWKRLSSLEEQAQPALPVSNNLRDYDGAGPSEAGPVPWILSGWRRKVHQWPESTPGPTRRSSGITSWSWP
ncbi:DUF2933 domain-containing protein, partial [bacterium]